MDSSLTLPGLTDEQDILSTSTQKIIDTFNFQSVEIYTKDFPLASGREFLLVILLNKLVNPNGNTNKRNRRYKTYRSDKGLSFEEQRFCMLSDTRVRLRSNVYTFLRMKIWPECLKNAIS